VAYTLDYAEPLRLFFRGISGVTRQARINLFYPLRETLSENGDAVRAEPDRRFAGNPDLFFFDIIIRSTEGGGPFRHFRFVVDDSSAAYGVLQIVYAEEAA
jgi:hypothetical protein